MTRIYKAIPTGLLVLSFCITMASARAWAEGAPADKGQPKSATSPAVTMRMVDHPAPAMRSKLKMHWECFKSGGKWKAVTTAHFDEATKSYSETKTWACQKK